MALKQQIYSSLIGLGLMLGVVEVATPQMGQPMPEPPSQFRSLEQPLLLKVGITLGGLTLIGVELWWFLWSKTSAKQAIENQGIQELTITVDGGYIPDRVVVQSGQPVRLNFFRTDPSDCLEKVLLPDFHKSVDLWLDQTISVEFTPEKPGNYIFHCGMNMYRGVIEVRANRQ
jgi:plastocyanin domain-containing protein